MQCKALYDTKGCVARHMSSRAELEVAVEERRGVSLGRPTLLHCWVQHGSMVLTWCAVTMQGRLGESTKVKTRSRVQLVFKGAVIVSVVAGYRLGSAGGQQLGGAHKLQLLRQGGGRGGEPVCAAS